MTKTAFTYVIELSKYGGFPVDMLRRDDSEPATPEDRELIEQLNFLGNHKAELPKRVRVTLRTENPYAPLVARWESFSCKVVKIDGGYNARLASEPKEFQVDEELKNYLKGAVGVVCATDFERFSLWRENSQRKEPRSWKSESAGLGFVIGSLMERPVAVSLFSAEIEGHKIVFCDATSTVVDHDMVREWLRKVMPRTAFNGDRLNITDAQNLHTVIPRRPE